MCTDTYLYLCTCIMPEGEEGISCAVWSISNRHLENLQLFWQLCRDMQIMLFKVPIYVSILNAKQIYVQH